MIIKMDQQTFNFFKLLVSNQEKITKKLNDLESDISDLQMDIEDLC